MTDMRWSRVIIHLACNIPAITVKKSGGGQILDVAKRRFELGKCSSDLVLRRQSGDREMRIKGAN